MNRRELVMIADQVFATYNSPLPEDEAKLKTLYSAWFDLLQDLDYEEAKSAFLQLAINAAYMPRPGDIRRATINRRTKLQSFDEPLVAWGKWMTICREVNSGQAPSIEMDDALRTAIKQLGDAAINMHTNSDRDAFVRTYDRIVVDLDKDRYAIKTQLNEVN